MNIFKHMSAFLSIIFQLSYYMASDKDK